MLEESVIRKNLIRDLTTPLFIGVLVLFIVLLLGFNKDKINKTIHSQTLQTQQVKAPATEAIVSNVVKAPGQISEVAVTAIPSVVDHTQLKNNISSAKTGAALEQLLNNSGKSLSFTQIAQIKPQTVSKPQVLTLVKAKHVKKLKVYKHTASIKTKKLHLAQHKKKRLFYATHKVKIQHLAKHQKSKHYASKQVKQHFVTYKADRVINIDDQPVMVYNYKSPPKLTTGHDLQVSSVYYKTNYSEPVPE